MGGRVGRGRVADSRNAVNVRELLLRGNSKSWYCSMSNVVATRGLREGSTRSKNPRQGTYATHVRCKSSCKPILDVYAAPSPSAVVQVSYTSAISERSFSSQLPELRRSYLLEEIEIMKMACCIQ